MTHTDGNNILHTPLVKHYNDLLERQSSERGKDEVLYFDVGDVFCIHLGTKYASELICLWQGCVCLKLKFALNKMGRKVF